MHLVQIERERQGGDPAVLIAVIASSPMSSPWLSDPRASRCTDAISGPDWLVLTMERATSPAGRSRWKSFVSQLVQPPVERKFQFARLVAGDLQSCGAFLFPAIGELDCRSCSPASGTDTVNSANAANRVRVFHSLDNIGHRSADRPRGPSAPLENGSISITPPIVIRLARRMTPVSADPPDRPVNPSLAMVA